VKAIFFDLDDTLFDCSGSIIDNARKRAAKAMVESGLPCSETRAYKLQIDLFEKLGPMEDIFDRMCDSLGCTKDERRKMVKAAFHAYNSDEVENIKCFPDVKPTLKKLRKKGLKLVLITSGIYARQLKKIQILGLKKEFNLKAVIATSVICLGLLGGVFFLSNKSVSQVKAKLMEIKKKLGTKANSTTSSFKMKTNALKKKLESLNSIRTKGETALFLESIPMALPKGTWITKITVTYPNTIIFSEKSKRIPAC